LFEQRSNLRCPVRRAVVRTRVRGKEQHLAHFGDDAEGDQGDACGRVTITNRDIAEPSIRVDCEGSDGLEAKRAELKLLEKAGGGGGAELKFGHGGLAGSVRNDHRRY